MFSRKRYFNGINNLFANTDRMNLWPERFNDLPEDVSNWLGRLKLLYGVPINYLVPDENMLPPESIRFFYLDSNWIEALLDGAYSIGREPVADEPAKSFMMDAAALPTVSEETGIRANEIRPKLLGLGTMQLDKTKCLGNTTISGFLLRSGLVKEYPGLGVNAYPADGLPSGECPGTLLDILRMERLSPASDTLLCLFDGDAYRIDVHEAPEALHYGIDDYSEDREGGTSGRKTVYPFSKEGEKEDYSVTMKMEHPRLVKMEEFQIFRRGQDSRTLNMSQLASAIQKTIGSDFVIDASEMGFEMTEGVGMVSFYNKTAKK